MGQDAVDRATLVKRLKRIEGQIRGIQKMIEEERDCESVITQLAAARSALEGVGALVLSNYMRLCYANCQASEPSLTAVASLQRSMGIWSRVRVGDASP